LKVQQNFHGAHRQHVADPYAETTAQLLTLSLAGLVSPGQKIAITVGSRGITDILPITKAIVDHVSSLGCYPIIVPAMGSHGGATATGQLAVLEKLDITQSSCGCPISSSMNTVVICQSRQGFPVHLDQVAASCDHIIVANRIKSHTAIAGSLESGLVKMMLIGLGKHEGAKIYHRAMADYSFGEIASGIAENVIENANILAAVGFVENGYDQTASIKAFLPQHLIAGETEMLKLSKSLMPRLPFDDIDLLLVNRMGKDISGTGMDTNVIGRKFNDNVAMGDEVPRIKRIMVQSLTPQSQGNANGIGVADFCHQRVIEAIDLEVIKTNAITALHPSAARIPIACHSDAEMILDAASTVGLTPLHQQRLVWIRDTLHLSPFICSTAYQGLIQQNDRLSIIGRGHLDFDAKGNLTW
jgi:hypothetical protein